MKEHLKILGEYVGHLLIGALMFAALMMFGGAINLFVHWLDPIIGDGAFTELMRLVERVILFGDVAFVVWWSVYSTYKAIKEMIK